MYDERSVELVVVVGVWLKRDLRAFSDGVVCSLLVYLGVKARSEAHA